MKNVLTFTIITAAGIGWVVFCMIHVVWPILDQIHGW